MKRSFFPIAAALLTAIMSSCSSGVMTDKQVKAIVDPVIDTMSLRTKVAQLFFVDVYPGGDSTRYAVEDSIICSEPIGGIIYMEGSQAQFKSTYDRLQKLVDIPLATSVDGEFGVGMRVKDYRKFPRQAYLSQLPNNKLLYQMGLAIAEEMKPLRIDINFAPVVDVNLKQLTTGGVNTRSFGPSKELVADYAGAIARGMQKGGVIACAKHFPGHGDTEVDSHYALPVLNFSKQRLDDIELYPFRKLIKDGVGMVMIGHLQIPALDTLPASVSHVIVTDILRDELGFKGLVVTDALNMKGVLNAFDGSYEKATLAAYKAGVDILLMTKNIRGCVDEILDYIGNDPSRIADLDSRVRRVLAIKARNGSLSEGYVREIDLSQADTLASRPLLDKIESMITIGENAYIPGLNAQ